MPTSTCNSRIKLWWVGWVKQEWDLRQKLCASSLISKFRKFVEGLFYENKAFHKTVSMHQHVWLLFSCTMSLLPAYRIAGLPFLSSVAWCHGWPTPLRISVSILHNYQYRAKCQQIVQVTWFRKFPKYHVIFTHWPIKVLNIRRVYWE